LQDVFNDTADEIDAIAQTIGGAFADAVDAALCALSFGIFCERAGGGNRGLPSPSLPFRVRRLRQCGSPVAGRGPGFGSRCS
jgi:hypothetical protein